MRLIGITPVDLFFSVLPFHDEVERNIRHVPFGDRTIPVLDCTALAVFKAMFDRPRDWVDIEAMVEARSFDVDEAIRWIREMVGDDRRIEKLAALQASRRSQGEPAAALRADQARCMAVAARPRARTWLPA